MPNQGGSDSDDDERAAFDAGFDEDEAGHQEVSLSVATFRGPVAFDSIG